MAMRIADNCLAALRSLFGVFAQSTFNEFHIISVKGLEIVIQ